MVLKVKITLILNPIVKVDIPPPAVEKRTWGNLNNYISLIFACYFTSWKMEEIWMSSSDEDENDSKKTIILSHHSLSQSGKWCIFF